MSSAKEGIGRGRYVEEPLVITRRLGHPEQSYNEKIFISDDFNSMYASNWRVSFRDECWMCNKWKHAIVFFQPETAHKYFTKITDY